MPVENHFLLMITVLIALLVGNVTWTLMDTKQSYQEWLRVLRPGGKNINF